MRPSALSRPTPPAYNNRGLARAAKGDLRGALSDYDEAIRLQPNLAEAYYSRAAFLESMPNTAPSLATIGNISTWVAVSATATTQE